MTYKDGLDLLNSFKSCTDEFGEVLKEFAEDCLLEHAWVPADLRPTGDNKVYLVSLRDTGHDNIKEVRTALYLNEKWDVANNYVVEAWMDLPEPY